jgi:hypothetical protein
MLKNRLQWVKQLMISFPCQEQTIRNSVNAELEFIYT